MGQLCDRMEQDLVPQGNRTDDAVKFTGRVARSRYDERAMSIPVRLPNENLARRSRLRKSSRPVGNGHLSQQGR
jgi:hypothetical protein